ncbi:hypothetical protein AAU61_09960 [Desulfocarbo indianensis]|nr:hypothetical protein AAU61_09960 [Desulfocarbo indianensis]
MPLSYARQLELFELLRGPVMKEAIAWLGLPQASHGLDAGCGVGLHWEPLLATLGPGGRVTGVDTSPDLLGRARALLREKGLEERVALQQADIRRLPFKEASFDWVWSVDCAGYMPGDHAGLVAELCRVLKPGGRLALLAYSSQQLLPGYPGLEARLNASPAGQAPFPAAGPPCEHFLRLPELFAGAGLTEIRSGSFLAELSAPFEGETKEAVLSLCDMRWGSAQKEMSATDWELFQRLTREASPDCLVDQPWYYGFFTYTAITARKAA